MIKPKTAKEIESLATGGARLAQILAQVSKKCTVGQAVAKLDQVAAELIAPEDSAAFYQYQPRGAPRPYPDHVCISVNDEIVHGIPRESQHVLADGDVVTVDMGLVHDGLVTDSAITIVVGEASQEQKDFLATCQQALAAGIGAAEPDAHVGDISAAIQTAVGEDYAIFRELVGHGVGYSVHEAPSVPNYGRAGRGPTLPAGTVIAIEPMIGLGSEQIRIDDDGYTYRTSDASLSAHFEHSIAITAEGTRILTEL
jgi:methionyl aminopeptidase